MLRSKNKLFKQAVGTDAPKLPHPTSAQFDPKQWVAALEGLTEPEQDDYVLATTAILIGRELAALRQYIGGQLAGISKATAFLMITAFANREFLTVQHKSSKAIARARRGGQHNPEILADVRLYSGATNNQYSNADAMSEQIIDSLPHAYFYAGSIGDTPDKISEAELGPRSTAVAGATSLEHTFRYIWQNALWSETTLSQSGDDFTYGPRARLDAEIWQAWVVRQASQLAEHSFLLQGDDFERIVPNTISGYERRQGRKHGPIISKAKKWNLAQSFLGSKWVALKNSYLNAILAQPLPLNPSLNVTILFRAWWVLSELCDVLLAEIPRSNHASKESIRRLALTTKRTILIDAVANAGALTPEQAEQCIEFLTMKFDDTSRLFNKSLWGNPIIKAETGEHCYLVAPVLNVSNPIRIAEYWLDQGGATDGILLRGKGFERETREAMKAELDQNTIIKDWSCPTAGLPTEKDGEEIDGLIRFGKQVLVIDYKCFLAPTDPIERYNFLEKLAAGCEQAKRKALWLGQHPGVAARVLARDAAEASTFEYLPLVVTNQAYGVGFSHDGVPVIDRKYLELLCHGGDYVSNAVVLGEEKSAALRKQTLYVDQADLERSLRNLLANPTVMRRFKGRFKWGQLPVPTSRNSKIISLIPVLDETDEEKQTIERLKSMISI